MQYGLGKRSGPGYQEDVPRDLAGFAGGRGMTKNIYVGNLVWDCTSDDLLALFQEYGTVVQAQVITDWKTGRSRGFGFVEMQDCGEAQKVIDTLNGSNYKGLPLTVNEARRTWP